MNSIDLRVGASVPLVSKALRLGYRFVTVEHRFHATRLSRSSRFDDELAMFRKLCDMQYDFPSAYQHCVCVLLGRLGSLKHCNLPQATLSVTCHTRARGDARIDVPKTLLTSFDIVAVEATTEAAFVGACSNVKVDLISLKCTSRSFAISRNAVLTALARGAAFELSYAPAIVHPTTVRYLVATAARLEDACHGRNIVLSSGAYAPDVLRPPEQVDDLAKGIGLKRDLRHSACAVLDRALMRRRDARAIWIDNTRLRQLVPALYAHPPIPAPQGSPILMEASLDEPEDVSHAASSLDIVASAFNKKTDYFECHPRQKRRRQCATGRRSSSMPRKRSAVLIDKLKRINERRRYSQQLQQKNENRLNAAL